MVHRPVPDFDRHSSVQHSDFGVVYEQGGNLEEARRQYEWAVQKAESNHVAWANLGNVAVKMGDVEVAQTAWRRSLELQPGYGPAVVNLAAHLLETKPLDGRQWLEEQLPLMGEPWRTRGATLLSRPPE